MEELTRHFSISVSKPASPAIPSLTSSPVSRRRCPEREAGSEDEAAAAFLPAVMARPLTGLREALAAMMDVLAVLAHLLASDLNLAGTVK